MANLIQIDNFVNKYNDNLLTENSLLKNSPVVNFNSNTGSYSLTETNSYSDGSKCIEFTEVQNIVTGSFVQFDLGSALEYTADKDGNFIFQYSVYNKIVNSSFPLPTEFRLKLYVNAVLIETYINEIDINDLEEEKYYSFTQSFSLIDGDIVNFAFEFSAPSVGAPNPNFTFNVGGFKLEVDDKFLTGLPSIYSKPIAANALAYNEITGWASYVDTGYTSGSPFVLSAGVDTLLTNRAQDIIDTQIPIDIKTFYSPVVLTAGTITGTFVEGETVTGGTSGATGVLKEIAGAKFRLVNTTGTFASSELITGGTSGATTTYSAKKNAVITGREGDNLDLMVYFKVLPSTINSELDIWVDIGGGIGELYRQTFLFRSTTEKGVMYSLPSAYTLGTWEANGGQIYVKSSSNMDVYGLNFNFDRSHKAR